MGLGGWGSEGDFGWLVWNGVRVGDGNKQKFEWVIGEGGEGNGLIVGWRGVDWVVFGLMFGGMG